MNRAATASGLAHLAAVTALILASATGQPGWRTVCAATCLLATLLSWRELSRLARLFLLGGGLALLLAGAGGAGNRSLLYDALAQGASFSCLLSTLGLLRHPVRRSAALRTAAAYLLSFPHRTRYRAVNAGSHFLSLLFNVGIIPLLGDLLVRHGSGNPAQFTRSTQSAHSRPMLLAAMRGAVLMTIWSPMGLGFAIVTSSIPALDPVVFIALSFVVAMLMMAVTITVASEPDPEEHGAPTAAAESAGPADAAPSCRPLLLVLAVCGALLAATIGIHQWFGWPFVTATVFVLPLFTALWLCSENPETLPPTGRLARELLHSIGDMRSESAIFLSASVIGAALALFIRQLSVWELAQAAALPALAVLIGCLVIVPLAGALFVPHTIFVVLTAQLFGGGPLGQQHPLALGLALMLGWAMAIAVSPISAMSLVTGKLCGAQSHVVGLQWNRRFVLTLFALSVATVAALCRLGL